MQELEIQIRRIQEKLQQLLKQREALQKENSRLKEELRQSLQKEEGRDEQLVQLQRQVEILKAKRGEMSEAEKTAMEKKLNLYIREIDRCIALLSD